jgi:hypothetical protein
MPFPHLPVASCGRSGTFGRTVCPGQYIKKAITGISFTQSNTPTNPFMRLFPSLTLLLVGALPLCAQSQGTHLAVDITIASAIVRGDTVGITYQVYNRPTSQDSLAELLVDAPALVKQIAHPQPDSDFSVLGNYQGRPMANWAFLALIGPAATSQPLYFESVGIPDTVTFWAGGDYPPPDEEVGDTTPTDVIHYHSVPGTTVGVKSWPADRSPAALITRLRGLTQSACGASLQWITNSALCAQLLNDLDQAEAYRSNGQVSEAISTLDNYAALLSGGNGTYAAGVSSSAYWLLVTNANIIKSAF